MTESIPNTVSTYRFARKTVNKNTILFSTTRKILTAKTFVQRYQLRYSTSSFSRLIAWISANKITIDRKQKKKNKKRTIVHQQAPINIPSFDLILQSSCIICVLNEEIEPRRSRDDQVNKPLTIPTIKTIIHNQRCLCGWTERRSLLDQTIRVRVARR